MTTNPSSLKSRLAYGHTFQQAILETCQPLFDTFNITFFAHARVSPDGAVAILISNMDVAEHWLAQKYPLGVFTEPGCYLASELGDLHSCQQQQVLREHFQIDHAVYVINRCNDYADIFMLGTKPENRQIVHTYLTHMESIKRFLAYYQEKCKKLIQLAAKHVLVLPTQATPGITNNGLESSISLFPCNNAQSFFINEHLGFVKLTKQEQACIQLLVEGKSAKEIGGSLSISRRTAEMHIENIKAKFNCSKVTQLAYFIGKARVIMGNTN